MNKKALIASFMVAMMLLTVLSAVVTANTVNVSKETTEDEETTEENDAPGSWGFGFIRCYVVFFDFMARDWFVARGEIVECLDLDTGEVRQGKTRFWIGCIFIFLPRGHDYKISTDTTEGSTYYIIEDLGFFQHVELIIYV